MIHRRDRIRAALAVVAVLFVLVAIAMRPHGLPAGSAAYAPAPVPFKAVAGRRAQIGVTYAIDSFEAMHTQHPIGDPASLPRVGSITVHGWAVLPETLSPAAQMLMSVDGNPDVPVSQYGIPRPDVGAVINPSATNSGFAATLAAPQLAPGKHTVTFTLVDAAGIRYPLPSRVVFTLH
jgi:hypothetical protein